MSSKESPRPSGEDQDKQFSPGRLGAAEFGVIERSTRTIQEFSIAETLGVSGEVETKLLIHYFSQKALMNNVYNSTYLLSRPGMPFLASLPIIGSLVRFTDKMDRLNRKALEKIQEHTNELVDKNYPEIEDRRLPRTIELAVGDLIARSNEEVNGRSDIYMIPTTIDAWGKRWATQIQEARSQPNN